jgi:hypothetical protein
MANRRKRPLERQAGVVRDARLIVIACEDEHAVKQYFDIFRSTRIQVKVLPTADGFSAPQHVLARLDEYLAEFQIGEGDSFWLVCDCDHWADPGHIQNLTEVLTKCHQKGIDSAVCRPCFELWLLLHFAEFPTVNLPDCDTVGDLIRQAVGRYNKARVDLLPFDEAKVRQALLRANNQGKLQSIPQIPQTSIHKIVEQLIAWDAIILAPVE